MAKQQSEPSHEVQVKKPDSILEALTELHQTISKRAYELFLNPEGLLGGPMADWFRAERELVWRPRIELRENNGQLELRVAVAGIDPKQLDVQVTPDDILITAAEEHRHEEDKGTVHVCEFSGGRLFRSIHLPERVDPDSVKAEFRDGMLRLTAAIAKSTTRKVDVQAA